MGSSRGLDRLVFFTDAVTAIAITLLILPLVELVPEYAHHEGATVAGFVQAYWDQCWSFILSFAIIARLWIANHAAMEPVERQSPRLMVLTIGWAFTIVVLPLPTALIAALPHSDRGSIAFYIGTMTVSSLLLTAICWEVFRRPELGAVDRAHSLTTLYGVGSNAGAFVVALVVAEIFPQLGFYSLFLLFLTFPLDWIVKPRLRAAVAHLPAGDVGDAPRG